MTNLEACLPAELRGPTTEIRKIAAGLSDAGVYRVEAAGQVFVLKLASDAEPIEAWRRRRDILQLAATAGVAPRVVHSDEAHRAVLSAFVVDHRFPAWLGDPRTRGAAVVELGQVLRRAHDLPVPADAVAEDPCARITALAARFTPGFLPGFVSDAIDRVVREPPPVQDRGLTMSHNDANPSNIVFDGERVLLIDWDVAGPADPLFDLATVALFFRMDDPTCLRLLAAHDGGAPLAELPARFTYNRRVVAAWCGLAFLHLAREVGHAGATGETLDATRSLGDLRSWALDLASPDGRWLFGLALIKASGG